MELNELKFGGLHYRYREKKGRLVRSIDPFSNESVMFSTTLALDNWLVRVFTPGTLKCYVAPILGLIEGRCLRGYADLITEFKDGLRVADLIANSPQKVNARWDTLKQVANANGFNPVLRTTQDIRGNVALLNNLAMMRQHLVSHRHQSYQVNKVADAVMSGLSNHGPLRLDSLEQLLAKTPEQIATLYSTLFYLYRGSSIYLDVAEAPYGPNSKISLR